MLVGILGLMRDLKVVTEMEFWTLSGSLFHSRVTEGKNDLDEMVRRVRRGTRVWWLRRLYVGGFVNWRNLWR